MKSLIKQALQKMIDEKEFPKCMNFADSEGRKKEKEFIAHYYDELMLHGVNNIPKICLISTCDSAIILQDLITYMEDIYINEEKTR